MVYTELINVAQHSDPRGSLIYQKSVVALVGEEKCQSENMLGTGEVL